MTQHTKGPWIFNGQDIVDQSNQEICQLYYNAHLSDGYEENIFFDNHIANARLIAASPKLYSFVANKAESGDNEAKLLIQEICNAS